jgi:asparagine synthase (glutamine-hydrolysing)
MERLVFQVDAVCGIVGYFNLDGEAVNAHESYLDKMCDSIAHRGPDERGTKTIGPAALGMTRLSIIDLATGQQPITNEDGTVWIVFNGEIYNYQELQERVLRLGHKLATKSDTEVIVHLYEEYGVDALKYLEGMFAFVIFDAKKNRLFAARDRMGEKPLHWTIADGKFIFGSEIKSIFVYPAVTKELDFSALQKYLALEYVPAPHSIFRGINKLLPAHCLLIENGAIQIHNYWRPELLSPPQSEVEAKEKLRSLLANSVQLRLISEVPLGVFLSGGIDSSTIAAIAAEKVTGKLKTFSIGFSDRSFDESQHAAVVAEHIGAEHESVQFEPDMARTTLTELWNFLDEPISDASIIPTYFLSKMTRRHVTVALAGEGGDELLGGYPTYQAHRYARLWRSLPLALRRNVLEPTLTRLPVSLNNLSFDYKVKRFIASVDQAPLSRHLRWMGSIPLAEQQELLLESSLAEADLSERSLLEAPGLRRVFMPAWSEVNDDVSDIVDLISRVDLSSYLPDDLLVKSDRASMAASLEVRLPFLAYPLVEFALSLPSSFKLRGLTTKYLLRQVAAGYLPANIVNRPKKGFGIPVGRWLKHEFRPVVEELLGESFLRKQGIFRVGYVKRLTEQHLSGKVDRRKELWTLLMFQYWWRKSFDSYVSVDQLRCQVKTA